MRTVESDRGKVSAAANGASRLASMVALGLGALAGGYLGPRWSFALAGLTAIVVAARSWHHLRVVVQDGLGGDAGQSTGACASGGTTAREPDDTASSARSDPRSE